MNDKEHACMNKINTQTDLGKHRNPDHNRLHYLKNKFKTIKITSEYKLINT